MSEQSMAWRAEGEPLVLSPVPHPVDALIGRDHDVAALQAFLLRPDVRLLNLTGPGGVGKTRLAIAAAERAMADFAGVGYITLAAIRDADLVLPTIAQALAPREADGHLPAERLRAVLANRRVLLVLDNFEQILTAAPRIAKLLAQHAGLTVLITSRAVLHISGERTYPVLPLALPHAPSLSPRQALAAPAVRLFAARAEACDPTFTVAAENAAAVVEICRRLDGLPLAIELAAAQVRYLPPVALLARLDQRLPLLAAGPRDQPQRLQTMRDAIAWSYDLLSAQEQDLFRRLAVFAGGFTLDAAESVGGSGAVLRGRHFVQEEHEPSSSLRSPSPPPPPERSATPSVLDLLASLVDQSLVRAGEAAAGAPRFSLLETIREFAWEQLTARGEAEEAQRLHAAYVLALAETAQPALTGPEQGHWFDVLDAEHDNLRSALRWSIETSQAEFGCRLAAALWRFWHGRGHWSEGRAWLDQALASAGDIPLSARAEALLGAGALAYPQGDDVSAATLLEQALALFRVQGDLRGLGDALTNLGIAASNRADHATAATFHEEALATFRLGANTEGIADALHNLGNVAYDQADLDRAVALWEESLALERAMARNHGVAASLYNLGIVAQDRGDYAHAAGLIEESLTLHRELGKKDAVAWCLSALARLAAPVRAESAAKMLGLADVFVREVGAHVPSHQRATDDHVVVTLRETLGEGGFAAAWAAGQRMPLEEALTAAAGLETVLQEHSTFPATRQTRGAHGLTNRELDILRLLAAGQSNREIAAGLYISRPTVARHVANIFSKFGVDTRGKATVYALQHELI